MIFQFSGLLLRFVGYERTMRIPAADLGEAFDLLKERHPRLRPVLWDQRGDLLRVHRLVLNGELIRGEPDKETVLTDEDKVEFLTAVAGG
jgi:molybdopterin converting factor small subunit